MANRSDQKQLTTIEGSHQPDSYLPASIVDSMLFSRMHHYRKRPILSITHPDSTLLDSDTFF